MRILGGVGGQDSADPRPCFRALEEVPAGNGLTQAVIGGASGGTTPPPVLLHPFVVVPTVVAVPVLPVALAPHAACPAPHHAACPTPQAVNVYRPGFSLLPHAHGVAVAPRGAAAAGRPPPQLDARRAEQAQLHRKRKRDDPALSLSSQGHGLRRLAALFGEFSTIIVEAEAYAGNSFEEDDIDETRIDLSPEEKYLDDKRRRVSSVAFLSRVDMSCDSAERNYEAYLQIHRQIPSFKSRASMLVETNELVPFLTLIQKGANDARSEDFRRVTAVCRAIRDGTKPLGLSYFSRIFYWGLQGDPDKVEDGFFKSRYLVISYKVVFTAPSSADKADDENTPPPREETQTGQGHLQTRRRPPQHEWEGVVALPWLHRHPLDNWPAVTSLIAHSPEFCIGALGVEAVMSRYQQSHQISRLVLLVSPDTARSAECIFPDGQHHSHLIDSELALFRVFLASDYVPLQLAHHLRLTTRWTTNLARCSLSALNAQPSINFRQCGLPFDPGTLIVKLLRFYLRRLKV
ncbi:hypothetical protein C8R44DRAFT_896477 [Mycena epipterygia]|nr:hypothetical protein C8R44DRAFT_896477 [Mycena epipterygia]